MSKIDIFPYPTPIPAKIWGVPFGVDPSCWSKQRVKRLSFQPWNYFPRIQTYMTLIPQRHRRTDGRTDNLPWQYRATS